MDTKRYRDHIMALLFVFATLCFFLRGLYGMRQPADFIPVYAGARCLIVGCNPYDTNQLEAIFTQQGVPESELFGWDSSLPVYPPSAFLVLAPMGEMKYTTARVCWFLLLGILYVAAAGTILRLCPQEHKFLAVLLVSWLLIRSNKLLFLGQPATFSIALLVIGSVLLIKKRLLWLATVCLILSLAVKPHIGLLVVLYFAVRGIQRKYATLALAGALGLLIVAGGILHSRPTSGHWIDDLKRNVVTAALPGRPADPRPSLEWVPQVDLQAVFSVFTSNQATYNKISYTIFLALFSVWTLGLRRGSSRIDANLVALAAITCMAILPIYHTATDLGTLMLAIPGTIVLWHRNRRLGGIAATLLVFTLSPFQRKLQFLFLSHPGWQTLLHNPLVYVLLLRQQMLFLLILTCVYLAAMFTIRLQDDSPASV